jgi:hypothetical protein
MNGVCVIIVNTTTTELWANKQAMYIYISYNLFDVMRILLHGNLLHRALKAKEMFDVQTGILLKARPARVLWVHLQHTRWSINKQQNNQANQLINFQLALDIIITLRQWRIFYMSLHIMLYHLFQPSTHSPWPFIPQYKDVLIKRRSPVSRIRLKYILCLTAIHCDLSRTAIQSSLVP